jgi:hypothetical protein
MTLLGDQLTDRDKTEYFMASLIHKSYKVKKIDLKGTFNQACRDIEDFISKEEMTTTILKQHHHLLQPNVKVNILPPGVFTINNVKYEDYDFDSDQESTSHSAPWTRQKREMASNSEQPPSATPNCDWRGNHFPNPQWLNGIPPDSFLNKYCKPHRNNPPRYK